MTNYKKYFFLAGAIIFFAFSCTKKDPTPDSNTAFIDPNGDVYVTGAVTDNMGNYFATYWKNGVPVTLKSDGPYYSVAQSILVKGNDVYVLGYYYPGAPIAAYPIQCYWKNGVITKLSDGGMGGAASAMAVNGNDVYVVGTYLSVERAVYWKNGVPTTLSNLDSYAKAITIQNNDVYIAGGINDGAFPKYLATAVYWKNGNKTYLPDNGLSSLATAITVNGNDIYVGGEDYWPITTGGNGSVATYWKNGAITKVGDDTMLSNVQDIAFSNGRLYLAGTTQSGTSVITLSQPAVTIKQTSDYSYLSGDHFVLAGSDIYIAGHLFGAAYWKNGKVVILGGGKSFATDIKVVPR